MLTVACVLRTGSVYGPSWVHSLAAGVARHLPGARFVCLSDQNVFPVATVPLKRSWPGWWSKIELWTPGMFRGRVLYLDLDTVVTGSLADLASYRGEFGMISDFYQPHLAQSGIMAWDGASPIAAEIHAAFDEDPGVAMARYHGDGEFIASVLRGREERLDRLFPGQIASFKVHCRTGVPAGARLVAFHGVPKIHQLPHDHPLSLSWRTA